MILLDPGSRCARPGHVNLPAVLMEVRVTVVVIMIMVMFMIVSVVMGMIVATILAMFMMRVIVVMTMGTGGFFRIGAAFRIERRIDAGNFRAELRDHFFQHMIASDQNSIRQNLRRYMPVADVPRDARKQMRLSLDLHHRFGCRDYAHNASVVQREPVAIAQHSRVGKIEQEHRVARAAHGDAAAVTAVMGKLDVIGLLFLVPLASRQNFRGSDHSTSLVIPAKGASEAGEREPGFIQ